MRIAEIKRKTNETDINLTLNLDGGDIQIDTGLGFLNHMLTAFATHGGFGMLLDCSGDIEVDGHHTAEDCGITLGQAFSKALGDKSNIDRLGTFFVPMDEALVFSSADVSGRPFLLFDAPVPADKVGDFDTELVTEFFRAFASNAGITLHIKLIHGANSHHIIEAVFKSAAHALRLAVKQNANGVLSSKGVI